MNQSMTNNTRGENHLMTDVQRKVRETIRLLQDFALDPRQGRTLRELLADTGPVYGLGDGSSSPNIGFALSFYQMVNPVGYFEVSRNSTLALALLGAIEANLMSQRFKAAQVHLRMKSKLVGRLARLRVKADEAYNKAYLEGEKNAPPWKAHDNAARLAYFETHVYPSARLARNNVHGPAWQRLQDRMEAVKQLACNPERFAEVYFENRRACTSLKEAHSDQ